MKPARLSCPKLGAKTNVSPVEPVALIVSELCELKAKVSLPTVTLSCVVEGATANAGAMSALVVTMAGAPGPDVTVRLLA